MKYWIVKDNEVYHKIGSSQKPMGYSEVYSCPDGIEHVNDVIIVDKEETVLRDKVALDADLKPITEIVKVESFDPETGETLTDENGDSITQDEERLVLEKDADGNVIQETIIVRSWKEAELDQKAKDDRLAADKAIKEANQYKEDRKRAYPPIGDQLDAIYKKLSLDNSTDYDAIAVKIAQVKLDNPKPE